MSTRIYIPTYGRVHDQLTLKSISPSWLERTYLVARPPEAAQLRQLGHQVLSCPVEGIAPTRQWILDQHDEGIAIMMDDDLWFFKRREDDPGKFLRIGPEGFDAMMEEYLALFWFSPLVGIASRSGANRETAPFRTNARMFDITGVDVDVVRQHGFRIDRMKFMEDFDFALQFLTTGYDSLLLNSYCKDDRGSNAAGGCSGYRSMAGQAAAAIDLFLEWPEFVKLRQVKAKSDSGWATRTDVTVQWAKAANCGKLKTPVAKGTES